MANYIRKRFLTGLFVLLPIGLTLWILTRLFTFTDSILGQWIYAAIGFKIPGLGLLLTALIVLAVGVIGGNVVIKQIAKGIEVLFSNLPLIKAIYVPLKDIVKNFSNDQSTNFKKVVYVTYPKEGSHSIGFITKENIQIGDEVMTTVFVPTTPNPTSGFLIYVKPDQYEELDMPIDEALKTIISLGYIAPDVIRKK